MIFINFGGWRKNITYWSGVTSYLNLYSIPFISFAYIVLNFVNMKILKIANSKYYIFFFFVWKNDAIASESDSPVNNYQRNTLKKVGTIMN